jgi:beta-lactamase regulating signal transducer with metallopeptidase domain
VTRELLVAFATMGGGALLGAAALPILARMTAPRFVHDPASSHRALLWALSLAAALTLVPWLRAFVPHDAAAGAMIMVRPLGGRGSAAVSPSSLGFYVICAVGALWALAAVVAASAACVSVVHLAQVIRRARPAPSQVREAVAGCPSPGARRIRRVLVSDESSVPFAAIPWSPVVVLPAGFLQTFDEESVALAVEHEVTHVDRGDLWTSALVRALCLLFPFHPVAARIAGDIAFAREAAVDALVSTRDPHRYAALLIDVAANARFDQLPRPVSMDDTALRRRIAMLTDEPSRRTVSLSPVVGASLILAAVALIAPPVFTLPSRGPLLRHTPDSSYAACDEKEAGTPCDLPDFGLGVVGTCALQPDGNRLFCAPPPPP